MGETDTSVTLAVLAQKIDALTARLSEYARRIESNLDDHEVRLRHSERCLVKLQQGQGIMAGAQGTFTLIASAIAAWFGSR